jgi:hypothetical protein
VKKKNGRKLSQLCPEGVVEYCSQNGRLWAENQTRNLPNIKHSADYSTLIFGCFVTLNACTLGMVGRGNGSKLGGG